MILFNTEDRLTANSKMANTIISTILSNIFIWINKKGFIILTNSPFDWRILFQVVNLSIKPFSIVSTISKLWVRNNSQRQKIFATMMNHNGLRTDPCWTPTLTDKSSMHLLFINTLDLAIECIALKSLISHSTMPSFCKAHYKTFLETLWQMPSQNQQRQNIKLCVLLGVSLVYDIV